MIIARLVVIVGLILATAGHAQTARVLDDFTKPAAWSASGSDGVEAALAADPGPSGPALKMNYRFGAVSGYAVASRPLPLDLPDNYALSFRVRMSQPNNILQVKLTDATGQNVWWRVFPAGALPASWTRVTIRRRALEFAWGPTADKVLHHAEHIEFVVAKGPIGGEGSVAISNLTLERLPPEITGPFALTVVGPGGQAPDGSAGTAWVGNPASSLTLDLGALREFGGVVVHWGKDARPDAYRLSLSDDGAEWRVAQQIAGAGGASDFLRLPDADARYLRFDHLSSAAPRSIMAKVEVQPIAFGATLNGFLEAVAKSARRGLFPRGFSGEQPYWTLVGVDDGAESGLISEDGAIEPNRGGPSVEPFVVDEGGLVTWADVKPEQALDRGYLPIPSVSWRRPNWRMKVTAVAVGVPGASRLYGRYELANLARHPIRLKLGLAIRPLQVNGPRQFLGVAGGVSEIHDLDLSSSSVAINGRAALFPIGTPSRKRAMTFSAGNDPAHMLSVAADVATVVDSSGLAAGVLSYDLTLKPGERRVLGWGAPLSPTTDTSTLVAGFPTAITEAEAAWKATLDPVAFTTPPEGRAIVDTVRTSLAHILMSRHGPLLQPGTRAYDRSWIRDGAMMAEALDRMGRSDVSAAYLRWYATHPFANGKIPCCVDARGSDPTPENDSGGEFLFLAAETYRYTGDRALLAEIWPQVIKTVDYMDGLRLTERTAVNQEPERRMLYGLMPPSISHEGYSSKPAFSYWDDYWALRGYRDAVSVADALAKPEAAKRFERAYDEFRGDLGDSIKASADVYKEPLLFGAADLGDFDPTSTTIALEPGGEADWLPKTLLRETFERYWQAFLARRDGSRPWTDYTPYELRNVGAFIRLGERERAFTLMTWFLEGRRPAAWNGWAEVVGHDAREPRFIGDLPHAWVASDFIRSALDMFAYDDEDKRTLVLGAGLPPAWFQTASGVGVARLRTPYGQLDWSAKDDGSVLVLHVGGTATPGGGFDFPWPLARAPGAATLNGRAIAWRGRTLHLDGPGEVIVR